jgi:hypothetical protein
MKIGWDTSTLIFELVRINLDHQLPVLPFSRKMETPSTPASKSKSQDKNLISNVLIKKSTLNLERSPFQTAS